MCRDIFACFTKSCHFITVAKCVDSGNLVTSQSNKVIVGVAVIVTTQTTCFSSVFIGHVNIDTIMSVPLNSQTTKTIHYDVARNFLNDDLFNHMRQCYVFVVYQDMSSLVKENLQEMQFKITISKYLLYDLVTPPDFRTIVDITIAHTICR